MSGEVKCSSNNTYTEVVYIKKDLLALTDRVNQLELKNEDLLITLAKMNENLKYLIEKIDQSSRDNKEIENKLEELSNRLYKLEKMHYELIGTIKGVQWTVKFISGIIALLSGLGIFKIISFLVR